MPTTIVGRTDPEAFTATAFVGFGGRAIAYEPSLGETAQASLNGTTFRFIINDFFGAPDVKFCIYDANTRALLESVAVPSSVGTGLQEVPMLGTTPFVSGQQYKIAVYNNSPGEQIILNVDPSGLPVGFVDGDYANPANPIGAEPFPELIANREFYWEVLGEDNPPPAEGDNIVRPVVNELVKEITRVSL